MDIPVNNSLKNNLSYISVDLHQLWGEGCVSIKDTKAASNAEKDILIESIPFESLLFLNPQFPPSEAEERGRG